MRVRRNRLALTHPRAWKPVGTLSHKGEGIRTP